MRLKPALAACLGVVVACGSSGSVPPSTPEAGPSNEDGGSTSGLDGGTITLEAAPSYDSPGAPGDAATPGDSATRGDSVTKGDAPTAGDSATGGDGGCASVYGSGIFSAPNVWTKDVSCDPVDPNSKTITDALAAAGGWGSGLTTFQIDMGLAILHATASTPMVPFAQAAGYPTPDCDVFSTIPLPPGGAIEGTTGYTCDTANNDCHLLIAYPPTHTLYEIYQATTQGTGIVGGCGILWDLTKTYPANMRGDQCTSADAAGFPLSAMLPDADEVGSGAVLHAIRFALPNARIRAGVYVNPASHAGAPMGGPNLPPYGVRMRLRADYPVNNLVSVGARVLAKALQRFGMFLSDGGNIPLMVASDAFTTHKWSDVNLDSHSLFGISATDFEVVDLNPTVKLTYTCVRNP
ncbi:MAG: hypothetical protein M3O46_02165 [Myxococcota bacterium]|nr:hypothetical protein [Myxococcota bacterium]